MKNRTLLLTMLFFGMNHLSTLLAQRVHSLVSTIQVDSIMTVKPGASKMAFNPITQSIFYSSSDGNIYEVFETVGVDSLRFDASQHGLTRVQGLCFLDSTMFLAGNLWGNTTGVGLIVKGKLMPDGARQWTTIVVTEAYPTSSPYGDHGFTGINLDPSGQFLYFSGGSRTSFGEVESNSGNYPGMREQALTSKIYRVPVDAENLYWLNDSTFLENSGFVFAEGTRNAYDMAWNAENHLFAIDNAGERDDPEELNWIQQGHHYGFPWRIGGNENPLLSPTYDAAQDPLINPQNSAFLAGDFNPDPLFPPIPTGIQFTEPLRHYGNAADYYKDALSGEIKRANVEDTFIRTFTAHRSPLGLVIDRDSLMNGIFKGKSFIMSFMPGGDSTGSTPLSPWGSPCPFVDPSRELVMMSLDFDTSLMDYVIHSENIATGFYLPVDVEQLENVLYIIENNGVLWKLTFPSQIIESPICYAEGLIVYPNPFSSACQVYFPNPSAETRTIKLYAQSGTLVYQSVPFNDSFFELEKPLIANGNYTLVIDASGEQRAKQQVIMY